MAGKDKQVRVHDEPERRVKVDRYKIAVAEGKRAKKQLIAKRKLAQLKKRHNLKLRNKDGTTVLHGVPGEEEMNWYK